MHLYIGSYTSNGGEGIYQYFLDPVTGTLAREHTLAGVVNPSFLALAPGGRFLYCVNEVESYYGRPEGAVSAFAVEPGNGRLRFLNQQPSLGASPCHLAIDRTGRFAMVANYGGANLAVLPILSDGKLAPAVGSHRHEGSGPNPIRQEAPHPHCVAVDPFNRHVLAVDLGIDRVMAYALDPERGHLRPAEAPFAAAHPGSGPRHLAFHPDGKWVYVVHELQARVAHYAYNRKTGVLTEVATHACLPDGYAGENYPSGLEFHPAGKSLYVSNRGHDSIAHFRVKATDGSLELADCVPTHGKFPRHFAIEPGGRFLVAANQRSDSLSVFRIDSATGALDLTGRTESVPSPVCVRFG